MRPPSLDWYSHPRWDRWHLSNGPMTCAWKVALFTGVGGTPMRSPERASLTVATPSLVNSVWNHVRPASNDTSTTWPQAHKTLGGSPIMNLTAVDPASLSAGPAMDQVWPPSWLTAGQTVFDEGDP